MTLSARALTTLATLKTELGISGSDSDTRLERMIEATSEAMSREAGGRIFQREAGAIHKIAGYGYPRLILPSAPVVSIASIVLIDSDGTVIYTYASTDYAIEDANNGFVRNDGLWASTAPEGPGIDKRQLPGEERFGYKVTYTAGWITPWQADASYPGGSVGTRNLPYELEEACIQSAGVWFRTSQRDPTIQSQTTERQTTVYGAFSSQAEKRAGVLTLEAQAIAKRYRREVDWG